MTARYPSKTASISAVSSLLNPRTARPGSVGAYALSSNAGSHRRLGKYWKRIHSTGVHIIWIYYLVAYSEMLFEPELQLVGAVVVPLLLAARAIRILAWMKSRPKFAALNWPSP
jgi:hypothetical protein